MNTFAPLRLTYNTDEIVVWYDSNPKTDKYRSDRFDTDTFDSMTDKVFDAVNNLTVEDF